MLKYAISAFILTKKSFISRWLQVLHFVDSSRGLAVASITVEIPDAQLQKLQQLAQENGISLEDLLRASIEDWLSYPKSEFVQASSYVLKKNAQLYRRLA